MKLSSRHHASRLSACGVILMVAALVAVQMTSNTSNAKEPAMEKKQQVKEKDSQEGSGSHGADMKCNESSRAKLTDMQYKVICENGTEPAFRNEYWDNKKAGIYVDRLSGEPLFSSLDKFDSGTGWPSFTKPLEASSIKEVSDRTWGIVRTEVRTSGSDAHLGHVFPDGPAPTGQRYCINSASLRFVPVEDLEKEGFAELKKLFGK